jgi:serine/threonine protein kinase
MGDVYRARDTSLGRDVALKLLPAALADDSERVARFQREAQLLAALNHPHIAAIYGLEQSQSIRVLVLELVEGGTLADRIERGAVPLDEALAIARQIALGLQAAHDKGVVHRDLKPSNIAFTSAGDVKVLDFGLAKLGESGDIPVSAAAISPQRCRASFVTQRRSSTRIAGGRAGGNRLQSGSAFNTFASVSGISSPSNGRVAVSIS